MFRRLSKRSTGHPCHIEHFSETTLSRLEYGDADLYLGLNSLRLFGLKAFPETLRMIDLRPVRWVSVVSKDHPYVEDTITEAQYLALPHVFGWPERAHHCRWRRWCAGSANADIDVRATTPGLLEIPSLLEGTELIATLPEHLALTLEKLAAVKVLPLPFETPETREVVIWHKRNEPDPGSRVAARHHHRSGARDTLEPRTRLADTLLRRNAISPVSSRGGADGPP